MMDGSPINVDVTAPGAIIALALMFLKVILCLVNPELIKYKILNKISDLLKIQIV